MLLRHREAEKRHHLSDLAVGQGRFEAVCSHMRPPPILQGEC